MVPLDAWRSQSYINPNRIGNENGNQLGNNSIFAMGNELEWGKILLKSIGGWSFLPCLCFDLPIGKKIFLFYFELKL